MPPCPAADTCWLYLVRHGATANNCARPPRLQGRRTDPPLSEEGRRQARRTGACLASCGRAGLCSSPLLRARQTAEAIGTAAGLPVEVVDELIEVDVGRWEGLAWDEIERADPEAYRAFMADPATHSYLGGESLQSVQQRVLPAFERLLARGLGRVLAVVAHNVVNRCYLAHLMNAPLGSFRYIPQDNCGVNLLRYRGGRVKPVTVNAVFHLDEP
jgi:broad specificity phosphatase PhoE